MFLPFLNWSSTSLDNATCLADCNCDSSLYHPVCGTDGYTYTSPCQAGCLVKHPIEGTEARALIIHRYTHTTLVKCILYLVCTTHCLHVLMCILCPFWQDFTFHNCSCLNDTEQTASEGVCETGCALLFPFTALIWLLLLIIALIITPALYIAVRYFDNFSIGGTI